MADIALINELLQMQLKRLRLDSVRAVEAAEWLDEAGLLADSKTRPGRPLRDLLRAGKILGQRQESNRYWNIDRVDR